MFKILVIISGQFLKVNVSHIFSTFLLCRAREALRQCLPDQLKDATFANCLKDDASTKRWLNQLMKNLLEPPATDPRGIPLPP